MQKPSATSKERAPSNRKSEPAAKVSCAPSQELLAIGQVGFLEVMDEVPFGVFVDNGLAKELLVPFAEQTCKMRKGQCYAIGVTVDDQGRLMGTQRIAKMLKEVPPLQVDDWVEGQAWRREPKLGVFVIVEKQYLGLLPEGEPHDLKRGQVARFRVSHVLPDGKIQLSLRRRTVEQMGDDAERVYERLSRAHFRVGDHTAPEIIVERFGLSKKAFKRAIGQLFKQGRVRFDEEGNVVLTHSH